MVPEKSLGYKTILLVDDDPEFRKMVAKLIGLEIPNINIFEAETGTDAYKKIQNQVFDLLITDVKIPGMDGQRLMSAIGDLPKEQRPKAAIVVSGFGNPGAFTNVGTHTFVSKPFDPDAFVILIQEKLGLRESAREAARSGSAPKVDVEFINPFIEATLAVFEITANIKANKERVFVRGRDQISGDISAIVAMNSDCFVGSMAISFEEKCFLGVVEGMLGEKHPAITSDNQDAAGEFCNQIFGMAKKVLNEKGHTIQPSIPSVVTGKGHSIKHLVEGVCLAVQFGTPCGKFSIEAVIQEKK